MKDVLEMAILGKKRNMLALVAMFDKPSYYLIHLGLVGSNTLECQVLFNEGE